MGVLGDHESNKLSKMSLDSAQVIKPYAAASTCAMAQQTLKDTIYFY